ncbi:MAG: membrane protein insertase YidC, partial [Ignavibacteriaceae bacterium]
MDKQTTIAFVLIGIILVVWLYMTAPEPVVEKPKQTDSTTIVIDTLQKEQEIKPIVREPKTQENIPTQDTVSRKNEKITTIENEVFIVELSNIGGNIHKVFLKDFNNWYSINDKSNDYYEKSVQLINYSRGNTYNLSFVSTDGKAINTGDYTFTSDKAPGKYQINGKDSIIIRFTWKVGEGQEIIKSYKFNGSSYEIGSKIELSGMRDVISNNAYDLVWNNGLRFVEYNTVDEANYSNSSDYYGDEQAILDASSVGEKVQEDYHGR